MCMLATHGELLARLYNQPSSEISNYAWPPQLPTRNRRRHFVDVLEIFIRAALHASDQDLSCGRVWLVLDRCTFSELKAFRAINTLAEILLELTSLSQPNLASKLNFSV